MGQRDLTRSWICTAADHTDGADGVVGRAEGSLGNEIRTQKSRDRMYLGGLHRLVKGHIGENGGKPFCQHRFTCTGRADHKHVMSACGGDLKRALCLKLAAYVGEIHTARVGGKVKGRGVKAHRIYKLNALKMINKLSEVSDGENGNTVNHRRLTCIVLRHEDLTSARGSGRDGHRQNTAHRTKLARQTKLTDKALVR